ncbi:MAG: 30S ribosomal protein S9 [Bacteroidota bacterium]|nr:30S ribosomal protein S9 [Bacteroidota bacterium]MDP3144724.1 30S ribosomal protein S9 [Bacteroidota bacterium]MDP3557899.1 30S ribosomal protein S9 [Bacteroidota bacterium]
MEVINTSGRRKTSVARAYVTPGSGKIEVNGRDYKEYFKTPTLHFYVTQSLKVSNALEGYDVKVNVAGGGVTGQSQAIRLAIAKALVEMNAELKKDLRAAGLITRDPRMVERKKFGQKKARARFQFSKR